MKTNPTTFNFAYTVKRSHPWPLDAQPMTDVEAFSILRETILTQPRELFNLTEDGISLKSTQEKYRNLNYKIELL